MSKRFEIVSLLVVRYVYLFLNVDDHTNENPKVNQNLKANANNSTGP